MKTETIHVIKAYPTAGNWSYDLGRQLFTLDFSNERGDQGSLPVSEDFYKEYVLTNFQKPIRIEVSIDN